MFTLEKIKPYLIKKLPVSHKRKLSNYLEKITSFISVYLPKSLMPPYPSTIIIDPVNICNLKCPLCPTGQRKLNYKPIIMSFNCFKIIMQKIPSLKHICLFNWGEPFLNPSLFEMIRHAKEKNVSVSIHSNFSIKKDDDFFLNILESKLDTLVISLDGASQQTYSKYRIDGDFNLVLSNIKTLTKMKNEYHYKNPTIRWKFIVNRFNENEITDAKEIAEKLGIEFVTDFLVLGDDLPDFNLKNTIEERKQYWLPINKKYQHPYYRNEYIIPLNNSCCTQLFDTMAISPDGKVFPCCWITDMKYAFGDLTKESFKDIWYNSKYVYSRSLFSKKKYSGQKERIVCLFCNNFRKK